MLSYNNMYVRTYLTKSYMHGSYPFELLSNGDTIAVPYQQLVTYVAT